MDIHTMKRENILEVVLPCLKPFNWEGKSLTLCRPLIPETPLDTVPWVVFGLDLPHTFQFLTLQVAEPHAWSPDPTGELAQSALKNLHSRDTPYRSERVSHKSHSQEIIFCTEDFFSAERILDREFMLGVQKQLGDSDLAVGVPRRGVMLCTPIMDSERFLWHFGFMVAHQHFLAESAPISPTVFVIQEGVPVGVLQGKHEEAAKIVAEGQRKAGQRHNATQVISHALKDKASGELFLVITVGGRDFDLMKSQVVRHFMQDMQKLSRESAFGGRVEVLLLPHLTPENDATRMFMSDLRLHLQGIARESHFEQAAGKPIVIRVRREPGLSFAFTHGTTADASKPSPHAADWSTILDGPTPPRKPSPTEQEPTAPDFFSEYPTSDDP